MQVHGGDSRNSFQELLVLIQAYWDIASRRFVDNVCMCVEAELSAQVSLSKLFMCVLIYERYVFVRVDIELSMQVCRRGSAYV